MKLKALLSGLAAMALATAVQAAPIVNFILVHDDQNGSTVAGRYSLYAQVSGDPSQGLASFQANLTDVNSPGGNITTGGGFNASPRTTYQDSAEENPETTAGFTLLRAAALIGANVNGSSNVEMRASQDTVAFSTGNAALFSNVGITASSATAQRPSGYDTQVSSIPVSGTWSVPVLLATGGYNKAAGWFPDFSSTLPTAANVFTNVSTGQTTAAEIQTTVVPIPEPASLGLLAISAVGLCARRRRA